MARRSSYRAARAAMLRAATQPGVQVERSWVDLDPDSPADRRAAVAYLRGLIADPAFREAVEVSSRQLARALDRVESDGEGTEPTALRRAVFAVTRYLLRAAARPTPFGLLAGVSVARFADDSSDDTTTKVRLGSAHRRSAHVDQGWLAAVISRVQRDPQVLAGLRVVANDLCVERGDRLVLPYGVAEDGQLAEAAVRSRPPVRTAMALAATPVPYAELTDRVCAAFPGARRASVTGMLRQLVDQEFLLTDLWPPAGVVDPLRHVRDRLCEPSDLAALAAVGERMTRYVGTPAGRGRTAWQELVTAADGLHVSDRPVQVDLYLDADVRLPRLVATEVERAAEALLHLAPPEPGYAHLREYHAAFVERYGTGRPVPVLELLDPERGLDAPAGYRLPPSSRRAPAPEHTDDRDDRTLLLVDLATEAMHTGKREVELTPDLLAALSSESTAEPPPSLELYMSLLARSLPDVEAGDFRLVVGHIVGSLQAGASLGRFAAADPALAELLAELAGQAEAPDSGVLAAQLDHPAITRRLSNLAQAPRLLRHRLPVGVFAERTDADLLALSDLAVVADEHRLRLMSMRLGQEVAPTSFHMLNVEWTVTSPVRLLHELAMSNRRSWRGWSWGAADVLPYLPRIRYGRTVLAPAHWRPATALTEKVPYETWEGRFERWRAAFDVPDHVQAGVGDHQLQLNLAAGLHRRMLWQQLRRSPQTVVIEQPAGGEYGHGWLDGHVGELVVPLLRAPQPAHGRRAGEQPARRVTLARPSGTAEHRPGGEWLYAKLYARPERHAELLAGPVSRLVTGLPAVVDRWFFIRYADPAPHLRLRFHGTPDRLATELLPMLGEWADGVCDAGLASRLALDGYRPEAERYGGPAALSAAEEVFAADSTAVLDQLRLAATGGLEVPGPVLAAVNYIAILRGLAGSSWPDWLLAATRNGTRRPVPRDQRATACALVDVDGDWATLRGRPVGAEVLAGWQSRDAALARYAATLRSLTGDGGWQQVAGALLHMHHNRLVGIDPDGEVRSLVLAAAATRAARERTSAAAR